MFPRMPLCFVSTAGQRFLRRLPRHTLIRYIVYVCNSPPLSGRLSFPVPYTTGRPDSSAPAPCLVSTFVLFSGRLPRLCSNYLSLKHSITLTQVLAWGAGGKCPSGRFLHHRFNGLPSPINENSLQSSLPSHNMCPFLRLRSGMGSFPLALNSTARFVYGHSSLLRYGQRCPAEPTTSNPSWRSKPPFSGPEDSPCMLWKFPTPHQKEPAWS